MTESSDITSAFVCLQPEPRQRHLTFYYALCGSVCVYMCVGVCLQGVRLFLLIFFVVIFAFLSLFHFVTGEGDLLRSRVY